MRCLPIVDVKIQGAVSSSWLLQIGLFGYVSCARKFESVYGGGICREWKKRSCGWVISFFTRAWGSCGACVSEAQAAAADDLRNIARQIDVLVTW